MFWDNFSEKIESTSSVKFAVVFIILIIFSVGSYNYFSPKQNCKRELDAWWATYYDVPTPKTHGQYVAGDIECDLLSW